MSELIRQGAQALLSMFEVWLCYQLLYLTLLEKEYLNVKEKIVIWVNIVVWGAAVSYNRNFMFFSHNAFLFGIVVTCICAIYVVGKEKRLVCSLVVICYSLTALLDFFFMFLSMAFLNNFTMADIYRGVSGYKLPIFLLARAAVGTVFFLLSRRNSIFLNNIQEYKDVLCLFGGVVVVILRKYQYTVYEMVSGQIPYNGVNNGASLMVLMVIVFCISALYVKGTILQEQNQLLLSRDELMRQNYEELRLSVESHRQMIHDLKHHFFILQEYEASGQYEKLHEYLIKMNQSVDALDERVWTGHRVLDFILNQKKKKAEENGIAFQVCVAALLNIPLSDGDISVLFGNLLDNAIEACERMQGGKRWILFRLRKRRQLVFVEISNSIEEKPKIENGSLLTSKKDKRLHGYGLKSVNNIVEKYNGVFSYSIKEQVFKVNLSFYDTKNNL